MRLDLALVCVLAWVVKSALAQQSSEGGSKEALLKIARDYRDGTDGVQKSLLRAARFYEFIIDRSNNNGDNTTHLNDSTAEFELSELLVLDPTLSTKHSYLTTLIRAAAGGHPEAQHKLSVAYGTGIAARDIIPMDAGRAVFLEYMAALSGNTLANMGMGYRYYQGIGVAESCEASLPHYEFAANVAAQAIEEQGMLTTQPDTLKLSEANDPAGKWSKRESTQELTDYYAQLAEQGDAMAALTLGNMLIVGTRMAPANVTKALHFLNLAAEANNPSAAGLQGYVLLLQHLHAARREATQHNGDFAAAQRFSQSEESEATIAKILKLLRMARKKNDVNGVLGLGLAYFHGVGVSANLTKAVEHIQRAVGVHIDAGYYLGEICMGLQSMELSVTSQFSRTYTSSSDVTTDGVTKGKNAVETRMIESHMIRQAQSKKTIDTTAAVRGYMVSAQMGHVLAQHRLAHLQKRGLGGPLNCKETARLFKAVAERGPWMDQLAEAHAMYAEGNNLRAMYLFSQLAAVGVESAQYNAAYLVNKCLLCPPMDKTPASLTVSSLSGDYSGSDPLERQHRLNHRSAETNFRVLLKDHEDREKNMKTANEVAGSLPHSRGAPGVHTNQRLSTSSHLDGSFAAYTPTNVAFLPSREWRGFVMSYNTFHLTEQSDQELEDSLPVDHIENMKDACRVMRTQLCETRALTLFDLSAQQGNAEAFVQMGDMYYYRKAGLAYWTRKKQAAEFYQKAADLHHTQAIFNLGIMYEVGDGVRQDFHLAKRFYDHAAEVDSKARAPRDIALLMLEGHKTYHALFGPDATSHLLALKVPLLVQSFRSSTGWTVRLYTVWEAIEKLMNLEAELRALIERWVTLYHQHVLHPVRDVLDLLTAPLQRVQTMHSWRGGTHNEASINTAHGHANLPKLFEVEHSWEGYRKLLTSLPEYLKSVYDKAFDTVYLLLHYVIRGKPHPALSDRHMNAHDILALREELLLLVLLCMVFCIVLSIKVLRRRLNEAVQQQQQLGNHGPHV